MLILLAQIVGCATVPFLELVISTVFFTFGTATFIFEILVLLSADTVTHFFNGVARLERRCK